jgi:hypothetical protein
MTYVVHPEFWYCDSSKKAVNSGFYNNNKWHSYLLDIGDKNVV